MTKQQLINRISEQTGVEHEVSKAIVLAFFEVVKNSISEGKTIYIRTFGSFGPKQRAQKKARLIRENKVLLIEAHAIPSFKPSPEFMERVKTSGGTKE
jgi:DNA-binding protein HU-beta